MKPRVPLKNIDYGKLQTQEIQQRGQSNYYKTIKIFLTRWQIQKIRDHQ